MNTVLLSSMVKACGPLPKKNQDSKGITNTRIWTPIELEWKNLFNYGDNKINKFVFDKSHILIFGPNGSGKSSIFDIFLFALFQKTSRTLKAEKNYILNISIKKKWSAYAKLTFKNYKNETIVVLREWNGSKWNTTINNQQTICKEKDLERMIGPYDAFYHTHFMSQFDKLIWTNATNQRFQLLFNLFFTLQQQKEFFRWIAEQKKSSMEKIKVAKQLLNTLEQYKKSEIMQMEKELEETRFQESVVSDRLQEINKKLKICESKYYPVIGDSTILMSWKKNMEKLNNIEKQNLETYESSILNDMQNVEKQLSKNPLLFYRLDWSHLDEPRVLKIYPNDESDLEKSRFFAMEMKEIGKEMKSHLCETCLNCRKLMSIFTNRYKSYIIRHGIIKRRISPEFKSYNRVMDELVKKCYEWAKQPNHDISKNERSHLLKLKEQLNYEWKTLEETKKEYRELKEWVEKYRKDYEYFSSKNIDLVENKKIGDHIKKLKMDQLESEKILRKLNHTIDSMNLTISMKKNVNEKYQKENDKMKLLMKEHNEIKEFEEQVKTYMSSFSFEQVIKDIETRLQHIDSRYKFYLEKDSIQIGIQTENGYIPSSLLSGYEKIRLNLLIRKIIANITNQPICSYLFFDELFENWDEQNIRNFISRISELAPKMVMILHERKGVDINEIHDMKVSVL